MQFDIAESQLEGIGVQHKHGSFSNALAVKKVWNPPVLTSTALSALELSEARSSLEDARALGARLKAEGRI